MNNQENKAWLEKMRGHFSRGWRYPGAMGPQLTYGRHHIPPLAGYRRAAVLILLSPTSHLHLPTSDLPTSDLPTSDLPRTTAPPAESPWRDIAWDITLTTRAVGLAQHAGQVCFPGGRHDAGENNLECALREWCEELGPLPDSVVPLGTLPDLYVFASHHWVRPVLAITPEQPELQANPTEVETAFSLPLATLAELPTSQRTIRRGGLTFETPQYDSDYGGIWGATAMMIELVALMWNSRPQ